MKYLKVWMGFVTNSLMGRDDGYPEQKSAVIDSMDELVATFDPKAKYFKLEPIPAAAVQAIVTAAKDLK